MSDTTHGLGFRRRCGWCGVQLRWWQINLCRVCRIYGVVLDMPSPPCQQRSRWDAVPDGMTQKPEGREFAQCSTCKGGPVCYCTDTGFPTTPEPEGQGA